MSECVCAIFLCTQDKLKYRETVVKGFEQAPEALIGMMDGENIGKMIVNCQP